MSSVKTADSLQLLSENPEIPSDLTIKFEDDNREIKAHKYTFSLVSKVFQTQFYGPMSQNARKIGEPEVIVEQEFSYEAYIIFVRHIYGDETVLMSCTSCFLLFQLLKMANCFLMKELESLVTSRIRSVKITDDLLEFIDVYFNCKSMNGFFGIYMHLRAKIVSYFSKKPKIEQYQFYRDNHEMYPALVQALIDLMVEVGQAGPEAKPDYCLVDWNKIFQVYGQCKDDPQATFVIDKIMSEVFFDPGSSQRNINLKNELCTNCLKPHDRCGHKESVDNFPHVGMVCSLGDIASCKITAVSVDEITGECTCALTGQKNGWPCVGEIKGSLGDDGFSGGELQHLKYVCR